MTEYIYTLQVMAGVIRFFDMFLSLVGVTVVSIAAIPQMAIAMVGW